MPPTKGSYVPMAESIVAESSYKDVLMEFVAPPVFEFRFRYLSEFTKGSHGSLKSTFGKSGREKSRNYNGHPTVKVCNCEVPFQLQIRLSTPDKKHIHPHKLLEGCKYENPTGCVFFSGEATEPGKFVVIELGNLNILHVGKEQMDTYCRQEMLAGRELNPAAFKEFAEKCKEFKKEIENLVLLRVDLLIDNRIVKTIYSDPISNSKTLNAKQLLINRISKVTGLCTGNEEVFIFTNKLRLEDINKTTIAESDLSVAFLERDQTGQTIWEADGELIYCHNMVAIIVKTPPYRDRTIDNPVEVWVQLRRKNDPESWSEEREFRYVPNEESDIRRKRAKVMHDYPVQGDVGPFSESSSIPVTCPDEEVVEEVVIPHRPQYSIQDKLKRSANDPEEALVPPKDNRRRVLHLDVNYPDTDQYVSAYDEDEAESRYSTSCSPKRPGSPPTGSKRKTKLLSKTIAKLRKRISY